MRQRRFCLSSCSSLPHHGLPRSHTWPRTLTTPLHATTLHSHLLPAHIPAPCSHLYFGYKWPVWGVPLGLASVFAKDSVTFHIPHTPWQSIQKSLGCTPLFPSPKTVRLWGVHRHRTGWRFVGVPSQSTLQTVQVALFRYMFDVILAIHKNMMTTSGTHLQGLHSTKVRHHTHIDMLHVVSVLLNI